MNEIITLPRRIIDTTAINAPSLDREWKYAKSAIEIKIEIKGIHQLHLNLELVFLFISKRMLPIIAT